MVGKSLAHYKITSQLGKGGMGEVYRAKDQKLGREVAIKVLPEEFARDADRVARFQREAKLLASLNHPNIAAIHGLEESGGTHFLVLELVEGDTLADRLKRGPIPVEESLKLALQIAEALEAAHEKGVIHRDLKPANIKVTPDGTVKVLDFGLAKAYAGGPEDMILSDSPTLSLAATQQGVILGTAAYMSPEQAKGKAADKRTDIWAFGCVLYEMLTAQPAFQGEDVTEILAAVVKLNANMDLLPANIHPRINELLTRCLQKDKRRRYADITDARYDMEQVLADPRGVLVQPIAAVKPRRKVRVGLPWMAAAVLVSFIVALAAGWFLKPSEPRPVMRYDYDIPERGMDLPLILSSLAVSPDGMKIVYVANGQLYLKNSDELASRPIQGTDENPANPFFSPDGEWIGYASFDDSQLKKISVMGGVSVTLCDVNRLTGASWGSDNMILFGEPGGIKRVSADGGTPEEIIKGEGEQFLHPQVLPDGENVLFTVDKENSLQVAVQSLESGERKNLFAGGPARYVSTGHLVYALENDLFAIPFDPDSLSVSGGGFPVVDHVFRGDLTLPTHSAISDSGTLVYMPGSTLALPGQRRTLVWVDREGKEESLSAEPRDYGGPRISADGTQVALSIDSGEGEDIWIWDLFRENLTRLTTDDSDNEAPIWTHDGRRIAFVSSSEGVSVLKWKAADGTGEVLPLASVQDRRIIPSSWSSDGKILVAWDVSGRSRDIGLLAIEDNPEWNPVLQEEFEELLPKVSSDGQWMAYVSDETGEPQVYVRPFPDVDEGKRQVSTSGGSSPLWSPDGKELYYRNGNSVMAVQVGPNLKFGTPKELFSGVYDAPFEADLSRQTMWDISPDGKRFLMLKPAGTADDENSSPVPRKINIVINWFEELKQKVPIP